LDLFAFSRLKSNATRVTRREERRLVERETDRERERERGAGRGEEREREGNELHARRTTRCNFCKAEINILPLKVSFCIHVDNDDGDWRAMSLERMMNLIIKWCEEKKDQGVWFGVRAPTSR